MSYVQRIVADIFTMGFDFVIPVSGVIIAFMVALLLFYLRYSSFRKKIKKYGTKSRHGKMTPRVMPLYVPDVEDAERLDSDIAIFLGKSVDRRVSGGEGSADSTDVRFGSAFSAEIEANLKRAASAGVPGTGGER